MSQGLTLATLLGFAFCSSAVDATNLALKYDVRIRVEPHSGRIEAEVLVGNPPASLFYLNDSFEILRVVMADGRDVAFHRDNSATQLSYAEGNAIAVEARLPQELLVQYAGSLNGVVNDVNLVTSELVELALYSGWYPVFEGLDLFTFELEANLPSGFDVAANGLLTDERAGDGRSITRWASLTPGYDIVLLASPLFQNVKASSQHAKVEILFHKMPLARAEDMAASLLNGIASLSRLYGPPPPAHIANLACDLFAARRMGLLADFHHRSVRTDRARAHER